MNAFMNCVKLETIIYNGIDKFTCDENAFSETLIEKIIVPQEYNDNKRICGYDITLDCKEKYYFNSTQMICEYYCDITKRQIVNSLWIQIMNVN